MPEFDPNARLDTSQIEDRRGRGGMGRIPGGGLTVGGGGIGVILLILMALLGGNPLDQGGVSTDPGAYGGLNNQAYDGAGGTGLGQQCQTGVDAARSESEDCRIVAYVNSIQSYWSSEFARRGGRYQPAPTVFFSGQTQTGCGAASSAVGPFYCPNDGKVYIDLSFFEELRRRFGVRGGTFAHAYVLAHEYGHHVQNLIGTLDAAHRDREGPQSGAVRVELQADCLAGVWVNNAVASGYLTRVFDEDIRAGLEAAAAVGDDRIQKTTTGRVNPEKWTHGSSQQRQQWFGRGYQTGDMNACDTFSGRI